MRIFIELRGEPNFSPDGLTVRSHAAIRRRRFAQEHDHRKSDRRAHCERKYAYLGGEDPTTPRMLEGILAMAEEHAENPSFLLDRMEEPQQRRI